MGSLVQVHLEAHTESLSGSVFVFSPHSPHSYLLPLHSYLLPLHSYLKLSFTHFFSPEQSNFANKSVNLHSNEKQ